MRLDDISPKSSAAMLVVDEDKQILDEWCDTNQREEEQQLTNVCLDQIFYDVDSNSTELHSLTDVLVYLTNNSKFTSKIQCFRLLFDRRYAVPIITPNVNRKHKQPFQYHVDVLKFIQLASLDNKIPYLVNSQQLHRIAIVSKRSIEQSETSHLIANAFGYIDEENDKKWPFLLLHVVGNYKKLSSFISKFANLVIIEQDSSVKQNSEIFARNGSNLPVIIWNVSENNTRPRTEPGHYVLTGTINGILKNLQMACIKRLEKFTSSNNSLDQINDKELFYRPIPCQINILDAIKSQDYSTLRRVKLLLQKSFNIGSEYHKKLNRLKNEPSEQRALHHKIHEQEQYRLSKVSNIEKLNIIEIFTNVLKHPNFDQRIISLNELIGAFDACQQAVRQKMDGDLYKTKFVEAKAIYAATLVSIEHLWKECSQLYTCDPVRYFYYPDVAAQYLIDGFSLELLDGDTGMICDKWINAVLKKLNSKLQEIRKKKDIKIFVLSILGVQSSGKSTLLNIMFSVRLRSSAAQCTRGVNIQLIRVENRDEYDYILLMDTEGKVERA
ncbi:unnamed protein product [Didymodactylos carnosus]|uniref:VLIG-type G domain-containing protein n=1 Tax=Didymodactylos carnosus TaxID=1234261 RepID=A0A815MCF2_9BILA|nr:unnamed protein product [Didymodactylos carnosus]CAF1421084.1 unnamed protein product [Didymodactylos carnosus]CAF3946728.1 unnamed protein product [Didymodactylos carnosus]CAF4304250.1 unnamed protein product [Didymodactylos carnosus]